MRKNGGMMIGGEEDWQTTYGCDKCLFIIYAVYFLAASSASRNSRRHDTSEISHAKYRFISTANSTFYNHHVNPVTPNRAARLVSANF